MGFLPPDWADDIDRNSLGRSSVEGRSLRQEIEDELNDHLACAHEREVRRGQVDPESAVIGRFGSPRSIATELWLAGMKGEIMARQLTLAMAILLATASLVSTVLMYRSTQAMQSQFNDSLVSLKESLQGEIRATRSMDWVTPRLRLVDADNEKVPIKGVKVSIRGSLISGDTIQFDAESDAEGRVQFKPIKPGLHTLAIRSQTDTDRIWWADRRETFAPGSTEVVVIPCPNRQCATPTATVRPEMETKGKWAGEQSNEKLEAELENSAQKVVTLGLQVRRDVGNWNYYMGFPPMIVLSNGQLYPVETLSDFKSTTYRITGPAIEKIDIPATVNLCTAIVSFQGMSGDVWYVPKNLSWPDQTEFTTLFVRKGGGGFEPPRSPPLLHWLSPEGGGFGGGVGNVKTHQIFRWDGPLDPSKETVWKIKLTRDEPLRPREKEE